MTYHKDDSRGPRARGQYANALRLASLALCLSIALARPAISDVVMLKNGDIIKCKVVKEMDAIVKVRMPRRGKIVTTFLSKGLIKSINRSADEENRKLFQKGGVRNPGRAYEPVYYSGSAPPPMAAVKPGIRGAKGKAKAGITTRRRGIDARRERSIARAKERASRFGDRSSGRPSATGGAAATTSAPAAPTTSGSSSTTAGSFGRTGTSVSIR